MAIYHYSVGIISRSKGRSATAAAAYRAAERIKDNRTREIHDYRKKKGVDEKFILAPISAPTWVLNREKLWNEVERVERRKDSQLSREINVALPVELSKSEQIELVKEFVQKQFVNEGMIADVAFHNLSSHNPHAHIMLTMRNIEVDGFSLKKNTAWNRRELLEKQREAWAEIVNRALEKAAVDLKIDHRTLEEQGINRIPQIHLGANVNAMMKRGIATEKGSRWLAIEEANKQIESLERSLAKVESEITREDARFLIQYVNTAQVVRQEIGQNVSDPRLDLEIYLRVNSQEEIIKQSEVYKKLEKDDPKIANYYLRAIAHSAITYKSLSDRKTPDLNKWAKKLVNSQLAKFYAQENQHTQNIEKHQTKRRGPHL